MNVSLIWDKNERNFASCYHMVKSHKSNIELAKVVKNQKSKIEQAEAIKVSETGPNLETESSVSSWKKGRFT